MEREKIRRVSDPEDYKQNYCTSLGERDGGSSRSITIAWQPARLLQQLVTNSGEETKRTGLASL